MSWSVVFAKSFLKDLEKLPASVRSQVIEFVSEQLPNTENPFQSRKLEKLQGGTNAYKARFGDYRVGLRLNRKRRLIDVCRVLHRREIYRYFP